MSWFSSLFKKKKTPSIRDYSTDIQSLTAFPTGSTLNDRILAALNKGQNIGYPAEYINRSTSPFIASRESGFKENELPFLNAEYGSRGLSRSTLATRDIGKAYAQKERDINEIMANAYMANLNQGKTDTARYENLAGDFAKTESGITAQKAGMGLQIAGQNIQNTQYDDALASQNLNQAIGMGLNTGFGIWNATNQNNLLQQYIQELSRRSNSPYVA